MLLLNKAFFIVGWRSIHIWAGLLPIESWNRLKWNLILTQKIQIVFEQLPQMLELLGNPHSLENPYSCFRHSNSLWCGLQWPVKKDTAGVGTVLGRCLTIKILNEGGNCVLFCFYLQFFMSFIFSGHLNCSVNCRKKFWIQFHWTWSIIHRLNQTHTKLNNSPTPMFHKFPYQNLWFKQTW